MTNITRFIVPVIVVLLVSVGYFFLLRPTTQQVMPPPPTPEVFEEPPPPPVEPPPAVILPPESEPPETVPQPPPPPSATPPPSPVSPTPPPPPPPPPPATSSVREFRVTVKKWSITPAAITVKFGDRVRLIITNLDVDHGFAIAELGVNAYLPANSTRTVEFTASKRGTFSMFCSVLCGAGHLNMKGSFTVQ